MAFYLSFIFCSAFWRNSNIHGVGKKCSLYGLPVSFRSGRSMQTTSCCVTIDPNSSFIPKIIEPTPGLFAGGLLCRLRPRHFRGVGELRCGLLFGCYLGRVSENIKEFFPEALNPANVSHHI